MSFISVCVWQQKNWRNENKLQSSATAGMQIGCGCTMLMIFTHKHMLHPLHCQPLVTPGYLTWPSQTNPWCQCQCSCCNLGQAIYKASSQVQAQGARGRQRDGRIKECLQGRETDLQSVGEKERGRTEKYGEAGWRGGSKSSERVSENRKRHRDRERERSSQVRRTAWIPEDERTPAINSEWHNTSSLDQRPFKARNLFYLMKYEGGDVAAAAFNDLDMKNVDRWVLHDFWQSSFN